MRKVRILQFAALLVLATIASFTLVKSGLHCAIIHKYHGRGYFGSLFVESILLSNAFESVVHILPCFVTAAFLWLYCGCIARPKFPAPQLLRLAVYPVSFLPLLALAIPARLVLVIIVHTSCKKNDWLTLLWSAFPGGQFAPAVYTESFADSYSPFGSAWLHPLRLLSVFAIAIFCVSLTCRGRRVRKLLRTFGLIVLILLWPVTMVYAGWFVSLIVGAQRYLPGQGGWAIGLVSGTIGLLCFLVFADTLHGGQLLLEIAQAWP